MMSQSLGAHVVADFSACGAAARDVEGTLLAMRDAVAAMHATLLQLHYHTFEPQGHTAVAILSESHLAVHSWPENDFVAVDAFTCGGGVRPEAGIEVLRRFFQPKTVSVHRITRGQARSAASPAAIAFRDYSCPGTP